MFSHNRTFSQRNAETGLMEWFFEAREGVLGPFQSESEAKKSITEFAQFNIKNNDDGGRSSGAGVKINFASLDSSKTKRGQDKDRT